MFGILSLHLEINFFRAVSGHITFLSIQKQKQIAIFKSNKYTLEPAMTFYTPPAYEGQRRQWRLLVSLTAHWR